MFQKCNIYIPSRKNHGYICNLVPGNQIASLREKQRKVIDSVIKAKIMGLSTPGGQTNG